MQIQMIMGPPATEDHQCRLLNHLGLYLFKDLIRLFRFLSFEVLAGRNAMEGPSMKAL